MNSRPQIKDADGEIAALVYSAADRPDLVLAEFATHTARSGKRIAGLIQFREHPVDGSSRKFLVLQSGQMIDIAHHRDTVKKHLCHVDEYWLANMVDNVCTLIADGVDAVIVNRFGRLEEEGRGFCDAIAVASEAGTPLVIAVPDFEFDRWIQFSNGMAVRLECRFDSVISWWRGVSSPTSATVKMPQRACELFK